MPLQRTPQQILIEHQPTFLDIGQEGGRALRYPVRPMMRLLAAKP